MRLSLRGTTVTTDCVLVRSWWLPAVRSAGDFEGRQVRRKRKARRVYELR